MIGSQLRSKVFAVSKWAGQIILLANLASSCSNSGEGGGLPQFPINEKGVHPVTQLPLSANEFVSGKLYLGTTDEIAAGFQIWRWDHDRRTLNTIAVDSEGKFAFPIAEFKEGQDYSFHVVDNSGRYLGPIDLTTAQDDVQAVATYQGGVGFELGQIVVPTDEYHAVDWKNLKLRGKIGGGFRLNKLKNASIDEFVLPDSLQTFLAATILVVEDTAAIYRSYNLRSQYPEDYAKALIKDLKISLLAIQSKPDEEAGVRLESQDLLNGARLAKEAVDTNENSDLWAETGFRFVPQGKGFHRANFIANQKMDARHLFLSVFDHKSKGVFLIPRRPAQFVTMIPETKSVNTGSGSTSIDKTSVGLLNPICLGASDLILNVSAPMTSDDRITPVSILDTVEVSVTHYDGKSAVMAQKKDDYPIKYRSDISAKTEAGLNRAWRSSEQKLRFAITEKSRPSSGVDTLAIPSEIFLDKVGDGVVDFYKMQIVYRGGLFQAGTALLLKKCG